MTGDLRRGSRSDAVSEWHIWQRNRKRRTGGSAYTPPTISLNGVDQFLLHAAALTGALTTAPATTFSVWFNIAGGDGTERRIWSTTNNVVYLTLTAANKVQAFLKQSGGAAVCDVISTSTYLAGSGWHHVLLSYNGTGPAATLKIDGTDELNTTTLIAGTVKWDNTNNAYGSTHLVSFAFNGCLAELYGNQDAYITDDTLFRNATTGKPVFLGANFENPTSTAPIVGMSGLTNVGTGGAFVENNGPIGECSTSP